jgi:hypothetical protein
VAVGLRLPTFRYPLVSDDEAIYDAMAQVVVRGGVMYRDTVDHKPPGLTYTYSAVRAVVAHLGGSFGAVLTGVHLLGLLVVVLTCVALHAIAREVLAPRLAALPPLLYAFASAASVPPDSLAVNGELLMNLPTALAVLCVLRAARSDRRALGRLGLTVAAGALCGVAALYKYQAAFVGLSFFFLPPRDRSGGLGALASRLASRASALAAGFALPFLGAALYFQSRGALHDAVAWGISFNTHYLAEGPDLRTAATRFAMQLLGVVLPSALVYGCGVGCAWRLASRRPAAPGEASHGVTGARALLLVWTLTALYSVTLGRRFFGHYFLQLELPLSLLAAGLVAHLWDRRPRLAIAALGAPAVVFFVIAALPEVFGRYVYAVDPDYWAVGRAVAARTRPADAIWVWGNVPQVYFTAERTPGVRFTFCNYLTGLSPGSRSELDPTFDARQNAVPGAWDMVVHDLDARRPAVIVDTAAGGMKSYGKFPVAGFPVLAAYLGEHYRADAVVDGAVLYVRRDAPAPPTARP